MMNEHEFKTAYRASEDSVPVNSELKQRLIEMAKAYDFKDEDNTQSVKVVKLENIKKSDAEKRRVRRNVMRFMALAACFIICATSIPQVSRYMNTGEVDPEVVVENTTPAPGKADKNDTPANNIPNAAGGMDAAIGSNVPNASGGTSDSGASGGSGGTSGSGASGGSGRTSGSGITSGSSGSNGSGSASGTGSRNEINSSDNVTLDAVQNPFAGSETSSDNEGGGMVEPGVSLNDLAHGNNAANQNASGSAEPGKDTAPNTEPGKDTTPNTEPGKDIAPGGEEKTTHDEFNGVFDSLANQRNKLSVWDSEISPYKSADDIIGSYYERFTERKTEYLKTADEFEEKYSEATGETEYSEAVDEYNDTLSEDSELYGDCRESYRKAVNYIEMNEIEPDDEEQPDGYETETDIAPAEEYEDITAKPEETYTEIDLTEIAKGTETETDAETDAETEADAEAETNYETETDN